MNKNYEDRYSQNQVESVRDNPNLKKGCSISVSASLMIAVLITALTILVKECKRADIRLEKDKIEFEKYKQSFVKDSLKTFVSDSMKHSR